jgi:hypothetical protein
MKEQGVDKRGQRIRTSEGLTKNAQQWHMRSIKQMNNASLARELTIPSLIGSNSCQKNTLVSKKPLMNATKKCWKLEKARRGFSVLMGISVNY